LLGIVVVVAIHLIVIWALITGLAQQMMQKLPSELMAKVEETPPPPEKLPPPPPPEMVKPPPPFVPPPDITVTDAPVSTTTITTQSTVATPPPAVVKPAGPSSPVLSPGSGNNCASSFYPPGAVRLNQEGTTLVMIHVATDGSVSSVQVLDSSGHDSLDDASIRCISARWHFKPAMENGVPVEGTKEMKVVWKLQ
jgi:protein TonB